MRARVLVAAAKDGRVSLEAIADEATMARTPNYLTEPGRRILLGGHTPGYVDIEVPDDLIREAVHRQIAAGLVRTVE